MNTGQDHGDAADNKPAVECLVENDLRALIAARQSDARGPKPLSDAAATRIANWMHRTSGLQLHGRHNCGGDFGADDVAQECLLRLWEKGLPTFNSSRSAKAFLRGMLRNQIATRAVKHARRRTGPMGDIDPADHRANPVEQAISSERPAAVFQSVARLPEPMRSAFLWRHRDHRTCAKIGAALGRSAGAISNLLLRGRRTLRPWLEDEWFDR